MARPRKNATKAQVSLLKPDGVAEIPLEEQPYPLPEGWKWVRLGSTISLHRGVSYKKTDAHSIPSANDCLVMRGGNVCEGSINLYTDNVYVDKSLISQDQFIKNLDIIIVTSTGSKKVIGRAGIAFQDYSNVAFGAFLTLARINDGYNKRYISFYFQSDLYRNRIRKLANGVNINNVRSEYITGSELPLPPLDEQQRIVDRIESLFARLDEAKEKAEAVLDGFEICKAALLHKAFPGELTKKWREENGVENDSWKEKDFEYIIRNINAGKNLRCEERPPHGNEIGIVKVSAVTWGFFNEFESKTCIDSSVYNKNIQIKKGDFLFSRANTIQLVGNCVIVENIHKKLMLSDKILRLEINNNISNKYILYFSMSTKYRNQITSLASGNQDGMRNISQKNLLKIKIPLPAEEEQQEIVRILDNLLAKEQQVKEDAENVLNQIDLMKKAILAKAFRGELGTHDSARNSLQNNRSM